ncbi:MULTISPECIES: acyl-CoA thioesterase [Streptomyces]|uniref:acyl-CoA thioesterase n=1 Tax=Streptomyces TaxID=1883 RepID=UPI00163BE662|nr:MULTISPECIES: thioesterase family protein [Streptomyces]MBC2878108.1 acyl-CoA thioesterase [Streptomyces sp. TYQ1024]UBI40052.1 acyl-CoA thioesterase [Streptomyces mobaraensis]UKW32632.1 acyl-CoA thioesterase [Streptomyces sp. TYQ1024]
MNRFTYACPLRWADADANGHINNAVFLRYMEEARTRMFRQVLPTDEDGRRRNAFVVARSVVDYRAPLDYRDEPVEVHVWVTKGAAATFDLAYEIRDDDRLYAEATTTIVAYNLNTGRPRRLSEDEQDFLARYSRP